FPPPVVFSVDGATCKAGPTQRSNQGPFFFEDPIGILGENSSIASMATEGFSLAIEKSKARVGSAAAGLVPSLKCDLSQGPISVRFAIELMTLAGTPPVQ